MTHDVCKIKNKLKKWMRKYKRLRKDTLLYPRYKREYFPQHGICSSLTTEDYYGGAIF